MLTQRVCRHKKNKGRHIYLLFFQTCKPHFPHPHSKPLCYYSQQQKHDWKTTQTDFTFSFVLSIFWFCSAPHGALVPVMPTSLDCVQGERDCLMLLPQFHLSVALTKAFDCQNPDSLDSNPLLFKCRFLLLIFFEALSKHDSALHSKAAFLSSCTNTGQFWIVPC